MDLHLNKKYGDFKQDFFRAGAHVCEFVVVIPKVRPSTSYSTGINDSSESESDSPCPSRATSTPSSSPNARFADLPDSRVPSSTRPARHSSATPTSSPVPTPLYSKGGSPMHVSRFTEGTFQARAHSDVSVLNLCCDGIVSGQFEVDPSSHPAYPHPSAATHKFLQGYDEVLWPGCLRRAFEESPRFGSDIGRAVSALNSTFGVKHEVLVAIIEDCVTCDALQVPD
ncbi:hypothetical protein B0H14DRAFT_3852959 [Mycena olivaceomarginata]|nr:hypothetical protein B0H14DRAFT_3852959 [Mycena olivaceomarginata]